MISLYVGSWGVESGSSQSAKIEISAESRSSPRCRRGKRLTGTGSTVTTYRLSTAKGNEAMQPVAISDVCEADVI
jgi:hypothetical protein